VDRGRCLVLGPDASQGLGDLPSPTPRVGRDLAERQFALHPARPRPQRRRCARTLRSWRGASRAVKHLRGYTDFLADADAGRFACVTKRVSQLASQSDGRIVVRTLAQPSSLVLEARSWSAVDRSKEGTV
jgi:hypothetical protein